MTVVLTTKLYIRTKNAFLRTDASFASLRLVASGSFDIGSVALNVLFDVDLELPEMCLRSTMGR